MQPKQLAQAGQSVSWSSGLKISTAVVLSAMVAFGPQPRPLKGRDALPGLERSAGLKADHRGEQGGDARALLGLELAHLERHRAQA